ncbi:MAG TPA: PKD domain-containing protein [Candidatus Thermoplasmatota archaeon]|nr:PKD domain-containing protein [Candidatus Thermoplasmatota archaeon]
MNVFLYDLSTTSTRFDQDVTAGVPDENLGRSGQVDQATFAYDVNVPEGATQLVATLRWQRFVPVLPDGNPTGIEGGPDDFDLYVFSPGNAQNDNSAGFKPPEVVQVFGPVPGLWRFEVRSFAVLDDTYTLWVNVTSGPANPVPRADQVSEVCFESTPQDLEAEAFVESGAAATGAWDLDNDGVFEASGMTAQTTFAVDSGAHLVRFRATATAFRDTILVAVRVVSDCPAVPGVVVVAVADTGINPYADQFAGELTPYPELRTFTTADPDNLGEGDSLVYHRVTGQLLPFTKHPSSYIPGFPADAPALRLTLGGGFYKSLDDAAVWSQGHNVVLSQQWMWIPGTKIVAAVDATDDAAENGAADPTPLYDDHGHGTASASVAVGNTVGTCPRCVLAFVEGLNNENWAEREPWIDFVSVSGSPRGNVGTPDFGAGASVTEGKIAAERGQTISFAAGNGVANAFDVPEQTYLPGSNGPDWVLRVGAVQKTGAGTGATGGVVLGTGKPVDWSSYGAGNIPASCRNSYGPNCQHSGTSSGTPTATGVMAAALLNARVALGDADAGQKDPDDAGGQLQAVGVGQAVAASPWLSDGVLTRGELWNVALHCAAPFGLPEPIFGLGPGQPLDWVYGGYGLANDIASACASNALVNGGPIASRPDADAFFTVDSLLRQQFWGAWDANGDGAPGGLPTGFAAPNLDLGQATLADLEDDAAMSAMWARAFKTLGMASPVVESYWLHHTGGCAGAEGERAFMDRADSAGDDDGCGGAGTPPVFGELVAPAEVFPSDVPTVGFPAGATVSGTVYIDYVHPGAPIVQVVLRADGAEIGRSAEMQPPSLGGFGLLGYTAYPFAFVTTAAAPAGAQLQLDVFITGSESFFFGYEDPNASSFTITASDGGSGGETLAASISAPSDGASFDKATTSSVAVAGTATFPPSGSPDRVWLRYDGTPDTCGPRYLSLEDGPDAGNGCHKTFGVAGGLLDLFDDFPADFDPVALQPGGHVTGKLYFEADGVSPAQVIVVLKGDGVTLGSETLEFVVVSGGEAGAANMPTEVPVDFALDGLTSTDPINDLVFEIHLERQGPVQWVETEDPPSFLDLPFLASPGARSVQVSVDDAAFGASSLLAVSGTEAWSATWDLAGVAAGAHTLYARAVDGASVSPASSVGVTVTQTLEPRVGSVQVQVVPSGSLPSSQGWSPADDYDTDSGAWAFEWDTLPRTNGVYDVHARLLGDGVEEAHDVATAEVKNTRAPVLAPIGPKSVNENELLTFTVSATDPDGDALTFSATGLPAGATFDPATRTFSWTPDYTQAGSYVVRFTVTDSQGDSDFEDVAITVVNVNRPPSLQGISDKTVTQGQTLSFSLQGSDADNEALTYRAVNPPAGLTVNPSTGAVSWTPGLGQAGDYQVTFEVRDPTGATAQQVANIAVLNNPPSAAGSCAPTTTDRITDVHCTDSSTDGEGAVQAWLWKFGDGATSAARNPSHTYSTLGTFTVTLEVTDDDGSSNAATIGDITVLNLAPNAAGMADRTETDRNTPVHFTDQSTDDDGTIASWLWAFGDGATSTERNPTHTYSSLGTKTVTLTVTDNEGATDSVEVAKIKVKNLPPHGHFQQPQGDQDRVNAVAFTDDSTDDDGTIASRSWNFGDGATSTAQNPSHLYASLGTFTVTLTVTDNDGGTGTAQGSVVVVNLLPTAAGSADRASTDRVTAVLFSDSSTDEDGTIASRTWNFGDGTSSTAANPAHTYSTVGAFTPTLTVTDNDGGQATTTLGAITVVNLLPTASGSADRASTDRLTGVHFTDGSSDGDGTIASRTWAFGDGATSTAVNPTHTYASLGSFTPTLTVTDNDGGSASATLPAITVLNLAPGAAASSDRTTTDRLTAVAFADASTDPDGTIASRAWDFGDGATSTEANPTHVYASLGSFTPTLSVTDNDGATASVTLPAITVVNLAPSAAFTRTPGDANRVDPIQFTDASLDLDGSVASWQWDFGDGATSSAQNPTHTYSTLGTFTVHLRVTDDDGDVSTVAQDIVTVVNLVPTPDFLADPGDPMVLQPVMFTDASVDRDGPLQAWAWDFGDGMTSTLQDPTHVYQHGGLYQVRLRVTDADGATAETSHQVVVCEPGGDLSTVIDPEHLHLELGGCLKLNAQDLVQSALDRVPPLPTNDRFDILETVFDAIHELNEDTIGLPGL